jgi:hypothetical protein
MYEYSPSQFDPGIGGGVYQRNVGIVAQIHTFQGSNIRAESASEMVMYAGKTDGWGGILPLPYFTLFMGLKNTIFYILLVSTGIS